MPLRRPAPGNLVENAEAPLAALRLVRPITTPLSPPPLSPPTPPEIQVLDLAAASGLTVMRAWAHGVSEVGSRARGWRQTPDHTP